MGRRRTMAELLEEMKLLFPADAQPIRIELEQEPIDGVFDEVFGVDYSVRTRRFTIVIDVPVRIDHSKARKE